MGLAGTRKSHSKLTAKAALLTALAAPWPGAVNTWEPLQLVISGPCALYVYHLSLLYTQHVMLFQRMHNLHFLPSKTKFSLKKSMHLFVCAHMSIFSTKQWGKWRSVRTYEVRHCTSQAEGRTDAKSALGSHVQCARVWGASAPGTEGQQSEVCSSCTKAQCSFHSCQPHSASDTVLNTTSSTPNFAFFLPF